MGGRPNCIRGRRLGILSFGHAISTSIYLLFDRTSYSPTDPSLETSLYMRTGYSEDGNPFWMSWASTASPASAKILLKCASLRRMEWSSGSIKGSPSAAKVFSLTKMGPPGTRERLHSSKKTRSSSAGVR